MTIEYQGIRRHETDVGSDYGRAYFLQNGSFRRTAEVSRRPALGKVDRAPLDSPILNMIGGWFDEPYLITFSNNSATSIPEINSERDPLVFWTDAHLVPPTVVIGTPVAPVITAVLPTTGAYVVGVVAFTPTITYDGLSGALSYSWSIGGPGAPVPSVSTDPVFNTNFNVFCIPGAYNGTLGVSTAVHGFTATFPFTFTVT